MLSPTIASSSNSDYYDLKSNAVDFSNAIVISDGYGGTYWNDDESKKPAIAIDSNDTIHAVWTDKTDGVWGTDEEIMYATHTTATGWSNATVISDGYGGSYWNDGGSYSPAITVNSSNAVHVVWEDATDGVWGSDYEIMHATYITATGWSNVTVISDGYDGSYWNDDYSNNPAIVIDSNDKIHAVWNDATDGVWGIDREIMHAMYTTATGWSNATVISDGYGGSYWNDGNSYSPEIAADSNNAVHVVWYDHTDGVWGTDEEIMYANFTSLNGWSNATVISDGYGGSYWNNRESWRPAMAINTNQVHVIWEDNTDGVWGTDWEIMYTNFDLPDPPLNPSIIINNGDASTNSTLVDLTLSADGAKEMCFRNGTTGSWSSWEAYATAKQLHLEGSINNTEYTIYVKFRNALGETNPIGDSILFLIAEEVEEEEEEIPLEIPGYPVGLLIVLILGEIGVITIIKKSKRIKK